MNKEYLWLIGALIVFSGTIPFLSELSFIWRLNGLIIMGIGGIITFYFLSYERIKRNNKDV